MPAGRDRKSTRLNSSHTVIYTLSLHDALPIADLPRLKFTQSADTMTLTHPGYAPRDLTRSGHASWSRSEEHTSELQSHSDLHSFPTRRSSDRRPAAAEVHPVRRHHDLDAPGLRAARPDAFRPCQLV